jgi:hypothetical protein
MRHPLKLLTYNNVSSLIYHHHGSLLDTFQIILKNGSIDEHQFLYVVGVMLGTGSSNVLRFHHDYTLIFSHNW